MVLHGLLAYFTVTYLLSYIADPSAVSALHAPTSKPWVGEQEYYFLGEFPYDTFHHQPLMSGTS